MFLKTCLHNEYLLKFIYMSAKKKQLALRVKMGATLFVVAISLLLSSKVDTFWEEGSTTVPPMRTDLTPRQSFFRWQWTYDSASKAGFADWDWEEIRRRKRLCVVAGISIDFIPLSTGIILNRRTIITAANFLEPFQNRQRDLRLWALGRTGKHITPYRYRVWRVRRVFPKSENPEHAHGPLGKHVPRHDVAIVHSLDQIYLHNKMPDARMYAFRATLTARYPTLKPYLWYCGSGYEYYQHIKENYKIFYHSTRRDYIVDCSRYLPKWWGKFICIINHNKLPGIQNGGGLFSGEDLELVGIASFEIRYNEKRFFAFTDLRFYVTFIEMYANISRGEYYEYAYPEWSVNLAFLEKYNEDKHLAMPSWIVQGDQRPLGK